MFSSQIKSPQTPSRSYLTQPINPISSIPFVHIYLIYHTLVKKQKLYPSDHLSRQRVRYEAPIFLLASQKSWPTNQLWVGFRRPSVELRKQDLDPMAGIEIGNNGSNPGNPKHPPPDAPKPKIKQNGKHPKNKRRRGNLAKKSDPDGKHGLFHALKG